jgi:hypothetical protein
MVGYPWSVRFALAAGYALLVGMWVLTVFGVIKMGGSVANFTAVKAGRVVE